MPPAVHAHPVTLDPTSPVFVDGVSCTTCGDDVIVYGGSIADRVWRLHLPTATWTEIPCSGTVPLPRYFHAAAHCNGYLSMCGGELIASDTYCHPDCVNYFELNLETFEWSCIDTFGEVPRNRSHHTLTALHGGKELVLFGGKPIPPGVSAVALSNRILTSRQFFEDRRSGFYDVFVLHPVARTWKRIEMFDPISPLMWGHSASLYNDSHILFFGGCDVSHADWRAVGNGNHGAASSVSAAYISDDPPTATLSNTVHILALETFQWQQHELAGPADVGPVPRALHVGECCCDELIVFGGFTINRFGGVVTATDCWLWSVRRGTWQRVEFCVPQWSSKKLLSCVYGTQWLVCPSLDTVFFMEMTKVQLGWQRATSKVQSLLAPPNERSRMVVRPKGPTTSGLSPPHLYVPSPSKSVDPYETPFEYRGSSYASQQNKSKDDGTDHGQPDEMLIALREEVRELRAELQSVATHDASLSEVHGDGGPSKRLLRWSAYNATADAVTSQQQRRPNANNDVRTAPSTSGVPPPKWHRSKPSTVDPSPGEIIEAPTPSQQHASPSPTASSPPPKTSPSEHPKGKASSTSSSESASELQPRFVDRAVIDKAAKRKVEAFRRLHARALDRTARDTEDALRSYSHKARDEISRHRAINHKDDDAEGTFSIASPQALPPIDSPRHQNNAVQRVVSSDSDENEDIHRVAELGLQLHRALVNNSESKRQLLFRERKRRIQQLQDRLRSLEASGMNTGGRSTSGTSGGSPDMKAAVDFVLKHSEAIQRMMDAHDAGEPFCQDASDGNVSAATSMAVLVPNTHEPPESLRSASFSSMTPSEAFSPAEISMAPPDVPSSAPLEAAAAELATIAGAVGHPLVLARDDSALSDLTRLDSNASDVLRRQATPTDDGGIAAERSSGKPPTWGASNEISGSPAVPPVTEQPVFRGFQRQRSQTSVRKDAASTAAPSPSAVSRVLKVPPAQSGQLLAPTADGSSNRHSTVPGQEHTSGNPHVSIPAALPVAPTNAALQNQWDVLQAALMSRSTGPRRVFVASDDV